MHLHRTYYTTQHVTDVSTCTATQNVFNQVHLHRTYYTIQHVSDQVHLLCTYHSTHVSDQVR